MNEVVLMWIGYIASAIIALSMTMSSIVKFRIVNFVGAFSFSVYGFLISSLPVGFLNLFIALVDVYYLYLIFNKKESFETLEVRANNLYLERYVNFHSNEIKRFFPNFKLNPEMNTISFFVLRDMAVAGLFLAHPIDNSTLKVGLDYVGPQYRDFKNGHFIYKILKQQFIQQGFSKVICEANSPQYEKYLKKIGFNKDDKGVYYKNIQ